MVNDRIPIRNLRRVSRLSFGFLLVASLASARTYGEHVCPPAKEDASLCAARCAIAARPPEMTSSQAMEMQGHDMQEMHHAHAPTNAAGLFLMSETSGTSRNPESWPMPMRMVNRGAWNFMFMGQAFVNDTQQSGPRGADKFFSTNWFMGSAERRIGRGSFLFDLMLSLEPATITDRRYPELFQTGETAFGKPIVDGQHPHDLFMGIGFHYAYALGGNTILEAYFAPVGDPALGPPAYPHRASAFELPQAPLGHHWQDSSHIVNEVATIALKRRWLRLELSGFHGAEPDENRWNIDAGAMDSWAARFSVFPSANWMAQVSAGRLTHPEAAEPGDVVRSTASVHYTRPLGEGDWSSSFIWGRNHKTANLRNTNSYLFETLVPVRRSNFLTGRWELVDKDELFSNDPVLQAQLASTVGTTFRIGAYTFGYTRDFHLLPCIESGLGGNFSAYTLPAAIKPFYGDHPVGGNLFLRLRLRPGQ